ncbi:calmodulin-binding transcription activator 2-like [Melia azedarach]|uniref:Calmodulin-binding transcription activator 2-like n=1 Tax=Melia azedarach TaxID=155640 RepID=A0ACC1XZQ1_MELAZ|nr:calmodulin-binding transcription activator 2-like [Melia azedarach]
MADSGGSYAAIGPRLDMQQLQMEAQHRWLRPAEICEILCNYEKFHIAPEPPNKPPSGSLFLFDRKVLRYFRKDGHNWRKKKDGKTVREAHEKLKVGSVDVLHCYYAHGEENENFQRRCYWMLEQDLMHIVFVHYLEVKGNKTNVGGIRGTNEVMSSPGSSLTFSFPGNHTKAASGITDSTSPTSTLTSSCEDADSGYDPEDSHHASSRSYSHFELTQTGNAPTFEKMDSGLSYSSLLNCSSDSPEIQSSVPADHVSHVGVGPRANHDNYFTIESQKTLGLGSWEEVLEQCNRECDNVPSHANMEGILQKNNIIYDELGANEAAVKEDPGSSLPLQLNWQIPFEDNSLNLSKRTMDLSTDLESTYDLGEGLFEQRTYDECLQIASEALSTSLGQQNELSVQNNLRMQLRDVESQCQMKSSSESENHKESNVNYTFSVKQKLLDGEGSLEKVDSFSRWMSKELGEVDNLHVQSSGIPWTTVECGNVDDDPSLSPSLSQDQLFSIIDFSPKWAYPDSEIEVVIAGTFLKSHQEVAKCKWSCMFAEVEVPADILADGVLCCRTPPHAVGQVPFYITCSNRLACSEVREFEYLAGSVKDVDISDIYGGGANEFFLHLRLERLLSLRSFPQNHLSEGLCEKRNLISKIIQLKEEEESYQMAEATSEKNLSQHVEKELILQKMMKEKLYSWLLRKVTEDGKGPSILDDEGQGVLHIAASLGYDWAIKPTVIAGVSINFRDVNGWTALHWAAFCGREKTVAVLVFLGAAPGALTDPSPEFPLCRTPADLASSNGHKGISGFLAESSLTSLLSSLKMNDSAEDGALEDSIARAVQTISERRATPGNDADVALSLKDSLTAICNATQAADRIHQIFRMQSFQRKQLTDVGDDEIDMSYEHALSILAAKTHRHVQGVGLAHAAAIQIQKKFRGWKKRKEFLLIRQRIVKIQAHVRGHQARKKYRPIIWSVGILEKVILRWRRKGSGLRGFRRDALGKNSDPQNMPSNEDDYDFLKEGRKQTEERLQKALGRVKSMVQYPEARAQYRRLLNVVEGSRETKVSDMDLNGLEEIGDADIDLLDIDSLLDDDNFMSMTFE